MVDYWGEYGFCEIRRGLWERVEGLSKETSESTECIDKSSSGRLDSWRKTEDYDYMYDRCSLKVSWDISFTLDQSHSGVFGHIM